MFSVPLRGYAVQATHKSFASPEEAVTALVDAMKADNMKEMTAIFGPASKKVLSSGDAVEDKAARERFLKAFNEKNVLVKEGDAKVILQIGNEDWPFPVPIVKKSGRWSFDTKAGKEELLNRRIGRNELNTIQVCLAYVDAQREYAGEDRDGDGLFEYAQKIISTPGKKDGLYWEAKEGEEESPLGDFVAQATSEGYRKTSDKPIPYHGYFFRILKAQGKNAPGGAYDYLHNGRMIGGFAMIAYPAQYGVSGVMTFIVNHEGTVYQKDLGKDTAKTAGAKERFDPDRTWSKIKTEDE
ncbi:MAG TPA: DUF2950 domain-containing protein [Deltaproteobacteria bacterium]|nr:DUF2950 domain-containing protein [Deltaproteobacteria bacterium]